jgi:hypothetical protein
MVGFFQMLKIYVKFIKINEYHVLKLNFKEPDPSLWYFSVSTKYQRDPQNGLLTQTKWHSSPYKVWIGMHSEEHDNGEVGPASHLLMKAHPTY